VAFDSDTIAVLGGTGDQGYGLVLRWAHAGRRVLIGSRVRERALEAVAKIKLEAGVGARVEGMENAEAAAGASIVVLSVPFTGQVHTLKALKDIWKPGQILVDITVPLEATVGGSPTRLIGLWAGSAAELAAQNVPDGVRVAAAFHNVGANALQDLNTPVDCDIVVCCDHADSRRALKPWVEAIPGCRWVDGGKLENSRAVEAITALLIGINRRYKSAHAGIRVTGISE
jgi:hypothetical protein